MNRSAGFRDRFVGAVRSPSLWIGCAVAFLALSMWTIPLWLTRAPLSETRLAAMSQIRTGLTSAFVALGAVGGLAYTARTFRESQRSNLIDRFQMATQQLGDTNPMIRMVGLHAMEQLADGWRDQRQVCIDALCAYVRGEREASGTVGSATDAAGREVRRTALEIIATHLRDRERPSWRGHRFDLRGAVLDVGDFSRIRLTAGELLLDRTHVVGPVKFDDAVIAGGTLSLEGARFTNDVSFAGLTVTSGQVVFEGVYIDAGLRFDGADLRAGGDVTFDGAQVLEDGCLTFGAAEAAGTRTEAPEPSSSPRTSRLHGDGVSFREIVLDSGPGPVRFDHATLTGRLHFDGAEVHRAVSFRDVAGRNADLSFRGTSFATGEVAFDRADLAGGSLDLAGATTGGGWIGLETVVGAPPHVRGGSAVVRLPPPPVDESGGRVVQPRSGTSGERMSLEETTQEGDHGGRAVPHPPP